MVLSMYMHKHRSFLIRCKLPLSVMVTIQGAAIIFRQIQRKASTS